MLGSIYIRERGGDSSAVYTQNLNFSVWLATFSTESTNGVPLPAGNKKEKEQALGILCKASDILTKDPDEATVQGLRIHMGPRIIRIGAFAHIIML